MKILHVVLTLKFGGLEKLVVQLAKQLKEQGIESEIICLQERGELAVEAEQHGIKVYSFQKKTGFDFKIIFKLIKLIKAQKPDVIHTHNFGPLIYGSIAALLTGRKAINTRHGRTDQSTWALIWNLNKFIVPVSEDTKEHLLKNNRVLPNKLRVIYNGIDTDVYGNHSDRQQVKKMKAELGLKPDSYVIGTVGRLSPEKDHGTLIKAFRKLILKKVDAQLVIAGDGPLRDHLEDMADQYQIKDKIKFLGFRQDIADVLSTFDVYVLSSYREGVSLSVLEAMAKGIPIVATNIGGNPEIITERETGYLVPCGFPERIEGAVMKMIVNKQLSHKMSESGQKLILEKFSLKRMAHEYEGLYKEALNRS